MRKILLIHGSRRLQSRTKIVMGAMEEALTLKGLEVSYLDIAEMEMDFCDGRELRDYGPMMVRSFEQIQRADLIVIGMPVYCYSVPGPLKNFIDITSKAFTGKKFAIVCNAGSAVSYLAAADLQKILGYECKSIPLFPIVFTSGSSFEDGRLVDKRARGKIDDLVEIITKEAAN